MAVKLSFADKQTALRQAIRAKLGIPEDSMKQAWLRDAWDNEVVYELGGDMFKASYSIDDKGSVTLGDPVKVKLQTTYVAERSYIHESIEIPVSEVTAEQIASGILPITILHPGFNKSKSKNYTAASVKETIAYYEGAKQYADHATKEEEKVRPERSIRDWVSTLKNIHITKEGHAAGEAHIHAGWFKELVQQLKEAGTLDKLGVSINGIGKGSRRKVDGVDTFVVESFVDYPFKSVDFVTEAGAGGQAGVKESTEIIDAYIMDLAKLKESRPDLISELETEFKDKNKPEVNKIMESEQEIKTLKESIEALTRTNTELQAKITEAEQGKAKIEAQTLITEAISKSALPEAAKARLTEQFKESLTSDTIEAAIKSETDYLAKLAESGKVKGLGHTTPDTSKMTPEQKIRMGTEQI